MGTPARRGVGWAKHMASLREQVVRYVCENNGVTVGDVASYVLREQGQSGRTRAHGILKALAADGRIRRDTTGHAHVFYAPGPDPQQLLKEIAETLAGLAHLAPDPERCLRLLGGVDRLRLRPGQTPLEKIASDELRRLLDQAPARKAQGGRR